MSGARVALAWLLSRPVVTSVILDAVSALPAEHPGWMIERQSADRVPGGVSAVRTR